MGENLDAPLWNYVEKLHKSKGGGGNWEIKCNFCPLIFKGSYSRVKSHLLRVKGQGVQICTKVEGNLLRNLKKQSEEADLRKDMLSASARANSIPLPVIESNKKRRLEDTRLGKAWNLQERGILDCMIARMFYASGLPFNLVRSPYFREAFSYAASHDLAGYTPPSYNKLRTTCLVKEKENIEKQLSTIKASWTRTGVSIASDGWTDVQRRPLINFMAVSQSGGMFFKAVDASGEYKDAGYMADLFIDVIAEVGPKKVVQLITDNAPVCKAAGALVQKKYPHIFWTPCVVHTLNLALKNICSPTVPNKPPTPPSSEETIRVGPSRHWDALSDNINLEGVSALEDAELYLDEPDLQPSLFDEEDATGEY